MPAMVIGFVLWLRVRLRWLLRHRRRRWRGGTFRLHFGHQVAELFTYLCHHSLHGLSHHETTPDQRSGHRPGPNRYSWQ
jgi:hypothetical protein